MSTSTLPKIRSGETLPTSASKLGELFSLFGGVAAGIYRVASLDPLVWVRETNGLQGAGFLVTSRVLFDAELDCNSALWQELFTNGNTQKAVIRDLFMLPGTADLSNLGTVSPSRSLAVRPQSYPSSFSLWGGMATTDAADMFSGGRQAICIFQEGIPRRKFIVGPSDVLVAQWQDDDGNPLATGIAGTLRIMAHGFFID